MPNSKKKKKEFKLEDLLKPPVKHVEPEVKPKIAAPKEDWQLYEAAKRLPPKIVGEKPDLVERFYKRITEVGAKMLAPLQYAPWTIFGAAEYKQLKGKEYAELMKRLQEDPEAVKAEWEEKYGGKSTQELLSLEFEYIGKEWKDVLPGGKTYEKYRELPIYQQLGYEAPFWIAAMGVSATGIRGALAPAAAKPGVAGVAPKVARAILLPAEAAEWTAGQIIRHILVEPIKLIPKVGQATFEKVLATGLDKKIAAFGRKDPKYQNQFLRWFTERNNAWLVRKSTESLTKRLAEKKGIKVAADAAAKDVLRDVEPLLLQASKEFKPVAVPPTAVTPIVPAVAKPPITPTISTAQRLVDVGKVEFDRLADTGRIAPFGGDVIEKQTTNELKAVVTGQKPVALIAKADIAEARKAGLVVQRVTAKGEKVGYLADVYGAYKKGNKTALDKLTGVFKRQATGELKGAEMDAALGEALGYSEADIAKYLQSVHGSYEEFVKATTAEVAPYWQTKAKRDCRCRR